MKGGGRDVTAQDVSKIISLMCRTHTNLSDSSINLPTPNAFWPASPGDPSAAPGAQSKEKQLTVLEGATWKPDVFVAALKEVVPNLNWNEVSFGFDHPEFMIKDRAGLGLMMTIIRQGLVNNNMGQQYPVECVYRHWVNVEGQLSLITAILKNPDIYSFADHVYGNVPVELLKTPPEADNKEIAAWKSMYLVEVLLYIADNNFYNQVGFYFYFLNFVLIFFLFFILGHRAFKVSNPTLSRYYFHGSPANQTTSDCDASRTIHQFGTNFPWKPSQFCSNSTSRLEFC